MMTDGEREQLVLASKTPTPAWASDEAKDRDGYYFTSGDLGQRPCLGNVDSRCWSRDAENMSQFYLLAHHTSATRTRRG